MSETGVRVEAHGWGWRHAGRRAWALRGLDLVVEPGERLLLLGPSGSGKSTLLAALAGLTDPHASAESEGTLRVDGRAPRAARSRTGLLLQDPESQLVMARAGDDVAFGLENAGVPLSALWARVDEALDAVGFGHGRERSTAALSGGEKQRLALAGLLALRPGLLLLDEPTSALDPDGAALVRSALRAGVAATGATVVLVEHRVDEVLDLVDRVVVLAAGGGVVADGAPADVFAAQGRALAAAGVWVPGHLPGRGSGPTLPETHRIPVDARAGDGADAAPRGRPVVRLDSVTHPHLGESAAAAAGDLVLGTGEAVVVTGPNGCGKSTLALLVAGLLAPATGAARAGSTPGARAPAGRGARGSSAPDPRPLHRWRARPLAALVGTVFQEPEHQFLCRTVQAELELGPLRQGSSAAVARSRTAELLERLHLQHLAGANPFTLSGGEQRRLSVATALATRPELLVLDEPTFGQDARTWAELVSLLMTLRAEGTALLAVTHDLHLADVLADRRLDLAA